MEHKRFDEIARSLATGTSRRGLLRGIIGAALGGGLGMTGMSRGSADSLKARICHLSDDGRFIQIEVSSDALPEHAGHGDLIDDTSCPGADTLDYDTCTCVCTPNTACAPGACGTFSDGCGGTFDCTCQAGDICLDTGCCAPLSTCPAGSCGAVDDGCGGTLMCVCATGDVCTGSTCCTPKTACAPEECGVVSDGCGGTIACDCAAGDVCNGGTCCSPNTTCQPGACGTFSDGCGGTFTCGCATDEVCEGGTCICVPESLDEACAGQCGPVTNNCGQTVDCDPCCVPITCSPTMCGTFEDGCGGSIFCNEGCGGCFVGGTLVALADGTSKPIEQVVAGDRVIGSDGRTNAILNIIPHKLGDQPLYAFNGGSAFVSAAHPFLTEAGWKAIDPEAAQAEVPGLPIGQLAAGDVLIAAVGAPVLLRAIQGQPADPETQLYDLDVDGDNTYAAAGLVVHNKIA